MPNSMIDLIGNTPLVHLKRVSELTGCTILGKAEFLNPGGSVKDRTALGIIRKAEADGLLKPGDTIVEGTAGNTGIGLTLIANALGYKTIIVMPQTLSRDKMDALELYGADLRLVPAAAYTNPNHYIHSARKIAEEGGHFWAQQFDNRANRDIHRDTTGEEIWQQTNGDVDGFICAVGTGGTLAGVSEALKAKKPEVCIGVADPDGSALHSHYTEGALQSEGKSITEGIGISFLTKNLEGAEVDAAWKISDAEALPYVHNLLAEEGLCLGGSSGVNIAGAVHMAKKLGPGHTIVTILCDHGERYRQKIYNPVFLAQHDLPCPPWMDSWTA